MKFCKDCRFSVTPDNGGLLRCSRPEAEKQSSGYLVTGEGAPVELLYCSVMRGVESTGCGAEGRMFEPKEDEK